MAPSDFCIFVLVGSSNTVARRRNPTGDKLLLLEHLQPFIYRLTEPAIRR